MLNHVQSYTAGRGQPPLLRRAVAFIHANVQSDIGLSDIAAAVGVTPRSVQYMFRRHLGTTPLEYLRSVCALTLPTVICRRPIRPWTP